MFATQNLYSYIVQTDRQTHMQNTKHTRQRYTQFDWFVNQLTDFSRMRQARLKKNVELLENCDQKKKLSLLLNILLTVWLYAIWKHSVGRKIEIGFSFKKCSDALK